jgi:hypothetical protein
VWDQIRTGERPLHRRDVLDVLDTCAKTRNKPPTIALGRPRREPPYPVLSEAYAERIAHEWNARDGRRGHVTRFAVRSDLLRRYTAHAVGGEDLRELWVPADELEEFCAHIVGPIEVVATFGGDAP